jgi:hypothetical protein
VSGEQRIRAFLYYLSLAIFFIGLPFILSFSLSYKFNPKTFKFAKAGLIGIKTQPQGASVYLNGKLLDEKTPCTINELLPGEYNIRLELEDYYSWESQVSIEAGQATRIEKIILFPLRSNIIKLNKEEISSFWINQKEKRIYYINQDSRVIYKSDLEGGRFEEVARLPENSAPFKQYKISPDEEKLLCFNPHQIVVIYLEPRNKEFFADSVILDYSDRRIQDVFWHSDSYHLVLITDINIEVVEAKPKAEAVNLVNLNKRNTLVFYDNNEDVLYFIDSQKASDGKYYDNAYKLQLGAKVFPFHELIKTTPNE